MVPGSLSLCVLRLRRELASVGCDGFLIRKTPSVTPRLVQMALLAVARDHQDTKSPIVTVAFFFNFLFSCSDVSAFACTYFLVCCDVL